MTKRVSALISLLCVAVMSFAQIHEPVKCETSWKIIDLKRWNSEKYSYICYPKLQKI